MTNIVILGKVNQKLTLLLVTRAGTRSKKGVLLLPISKGLAFTSGQIMAILTIELKAYGIETAYVQKCQHGV